MLAIIVVKRKRVVVEDNHVGDVVTLMCLVSMVMGSVTGKESE